MPKAEESARRIEAILRNNLSKLPVGDDQKILDQLWKFVGNVIANDWSQKQIGAEAAKLINRALPFAEVSMTLRDPKTKTYKYVALTGFRPEVEKIMYDSAYTEEEVKGYDRELGIRLDNFLDFEVAEAAPVLDKQYEELQYNRPMLLKEERRAYDEMKEGDYLVLYFRGIRGELLGYVELEAPRNRKLPQGNILKWIEIFGMIIGMLLQSSRRYE